MSYFLSILFLIVVFPLLGSSFLHLIKLKLNHSLFEKSFVYFGVGLGIFPFLAVILNLLHIPIAWWIFLILPLVLFLVKFRKLRFSFNLKRATSLQFLFVLIIFGIVLFVMLKGAFVYPYLEDDDSWAHALSAKYVAIEKNLNPDSNVLHYLNPYPPGYAIFIGVLHQTNNSIYWTLKFFNALIVALTIPFFYLFAKSFFKNKNKALFSTFILASLPCFLSHFIWAHSFVILLMLIGFYWMFKLKEEKKVVFLLPVLIASIFFTQMTQAVKFGILFFALFLISSFSRKKFNWYLFLSGAIALLLSLFWWGFKALNVFSTHQISAVSKDKGWILAPNIGSASRAYNISLSWCKELFPNLHHQGPGPCNEFLFPPKVGLMTNPVGIGWVVCILAIIGVIAAIFILFKKIPLSKKEPALFTLFFVVFTFLGVNSVTFNLPIGLFAFRFWMLLAIPVALLSSYGLWGLFWVCKKIKFTKVIPLIIIFILIAIIITSAYPKYSINTSYWPPGALWRVWGEAEEFVQLRNMPDLKLFPVCKEGFKKLIGNDQFACAWCRDELDFQKDIFTKSPLEISFFLRTHDYKGIIVDSSCIQSHSVGEISNKTNELLSSGIFVLNQDIKNLFILEVV